jgi:hypothetical protein
VRCNLNHRIGGGIDDGLSGGEMDSSQLGDDFSPGRMFIAEQARQTGSPYQRVGEAFREAGNAGGEIAPIEPNRNAGNFPMTGRRVLAAGHFDSEAPLRVCVASGKGNATAGGGLASLGNAHGGQIGYSQQTVLGNMGQGIGALITKAIGIGRTADAD